MSEPDGDGFLSRWAKRKAEVRKGGGAPTEPPRATPEAAVADSAKPDAAIASEAALSAPPTSTPARTTTPTLNPTQTPAAPAAPPLPTLADVAGLTHDSDYTRFMAKGVDGGVRNAAMKKLFSDPHFNVMDGLDTYIDDYGKPDPIPLSMLRKMNQSKALGLFADEERDSTPDQPGAIGSQTPADVTDGAPPAAPPSVAAPVVASSALAEDAPAGCSGAPEGRADDDADLRLQQDDGPRRDGAAPGSRA
jgi:hypothetical protein